MELRRNQPQLGLSLIERNSGGTAAQQEKLPGLPGGEALLIRLLQRTIRLCGQKILCRSGNEQVHFKEMAQPAELAVHDSNDRETLLADAYRLADDGWICAETLPPHRFTQDCDAPRIEEAVLFR